MSISSDLVDQKLWLCTTLLSIFANILFRHCCANSHFFIEKPVVPLAFFMHESKNESSHNQFFHAISNLIPLLGDKTMLFYNWQRRRIWKAIANKIPNSLVLRYWNHLFNNIRLCVRKHNGKQLDAKVYCNDCRELFKC